MTNVKSMTKNQRAFTLIELVLVIILLSIVAVSITSFYRDTAESYLQAEERLGLSSTARLAVEKVGREIREAMPNSIRTATTATSSCVEYVPIVAASRYTDLPTTSSGTQITVVEADADSVISGLSTTNLYVMVIPLRTTEVYDTSAGHFAQVTGFSKLGGNETQVTINSTRFRRTSPQSRIYFVRQPKSFCFINDELNRYENYGFSVTQPQPSSMGAATLYLNKVVLELGGIRVSYFGYTTGTRNRSGVLKIRTLFQGRKETVNLEHEVHVRNVP